MNFVCFPSGSFCTGRLIIFLPTKLAVGPGKEDVENTLAGTERKIFRQPAKRFLDRTGKRQSNFAEKNNRLAE